MRSNRALTVLTLKGIPQIETVPMTPIKDRRTVNIDKKTTIYLHISKVKVF